jgi:hypothetical protein
LDLDNGESRVPGDGENRWYHPEERWPQHPKTWFRDALDYARAHGWLLKKLSNHSFGWVYCRRSDDDDRCRFRIDSSGRGGENAARDLRLQVNRCPHRTPVPSGAAILGGLVDKAELLTAAAATLIDESRHTQRAIELYARAEELLDEAEDRTDEVSQLMLDAGEAESEARAARADSDTRLEGTGLPPGERAPAVLDAAERTAVSVGKALRREPTSPWVRTVRQRVRAARERISQLRDELKSNPPGTESFNGE